MRVAFQGEYGAYSEEAAIRYLGTVETLPSATFVDALDSVERDHAERAIIPVENSTEGSVGEANDAIRAKRETLHIVGETYLHVKHCLVGNTDDISRIDTIYSHPQALGQCRRFVSGYRTIPTHDTAGSVRIIAEDGSDRVAGIASRRAAEHYDRTVISDDISDIKHNHTRFVVLERRGASPQEGGDKVSVTFTLPHRPGSLHKALKRLLPVNLTRIESRPDRTGGWSYVFFADFVGEARTLDTVVDGLRGECATLDVLGSYRAAPFELSP
ncbi:MAG: prephenate dehydratase [Thaumarchaeota archaeon]|nr:prephenate dehydratase [Nitrososphaerota archaeon]